MSKSAQFTKDYANKEGFKSLLYVLGAAIVIMFFTQIMKLVKGFFGLITGSTSEAELKEKSELQTSEAQALIKSTGWKETGLPQPSNYYKNIANQCEEYMKGWGTKSVEMYDLLKNLSANELKAVYYHFGSRVNDDFSNDAGNLFTWFGWELGNWSPFDYNALNKMRALWAKTLLPLTF